MGEHICNQKETDGVYLDCHLKSSPASTFFAGYKIQQAVQRCEICTE